MLLQQKNLGQRVDQSNQFKLTLVAAGGGSAVDDAPAIVTPIVCVGVVFGPCLYTQMSRCFLVLQSSFWGREFVALL